MLIDRAKRFRGKAVILALNKVDKLPSPNYCRYSKRSNNEFPFAAMVPISALKGDGTDRLVEEILKVLPKPMASSCVCQSSRGRAAMSPIWNDFHEQRVIRIEKFFELFDGLRCRLSSASRLCGR